MAGQAYAMVNSLSLNNVNLFTGSGDITMTYEGAVVVNKASGAATQVTLPASPAANLGGTFRWIIDGKGDAATNNITVVAATGNINGAASYVISENYGAVLLFYPNGGTEWLVTSAANPLSSAELAFLNGVTAGTSAAGKAVVLDANSAVNSATITTLTSTTGIMAGLRFSDIGPLAATGTVIANAAAITNRFTVVSAADNAKGVILPVAVAGDVYLVISSVASNGLKVYPQVNSSINFGTANAAYVMEGQVLHMFIANNTTNWCQIGLANA